MNSPKRHMPPAGHRGQSQELLYDPKVPTPSHSENAKTLVERMSVGTLSTIEDRPGGYPYVSGSSDQSVAISCHAPSTLARTDRDA